MGETITADDILGKEAVDPDGAVLGIVMKIHIDKDEKSLVGITVDQGFMKPDLFIGIDYVKYFGVDAILLNQVPKDKFKGLNVLTADGSVLGTVKEVLMQNKKMLGLVVVKSVAFSKREILVQVSKVKEIGASVILKAGFKE